MSELATFSGSAEKDSLQRPLRILFTEGSSVSARQALYDLGPRHTIDVLDPSALCQCRFSRFVRRWYRAPRFTADPCGYLACLGKRLAADCYDVVLPLHDEVYLLSRVRDAISRRSAIAIADFPAVDLLQSKLQFLDLARELGLACPETCVVTEPRELERFERFPAFLKLEVGTAGQTVRLVHSRDELGRALADIRNHGWWSPGDPLLLQQPAVGKQGIIRGIFSHGKLVAVHNTMLVQRGVGGSAVAREGTNLPSATDEFRRVGARLDWDGALFGEYFYDDASRTAEYIEFNPRIGNSANAAFSGVNLMQHWVDVALGRIASMPKESQPGVLTHAGVLILMSRALEGASRGELLADVRRQRRREGLYGQSHDELTRPGDDWMSLVPYVWVAARLIARPNAAKTMVHGTVKNYALTADAAKRIREIPQEHLLRCLQ
jgi:hypothetical protein